MEVSPSSSDGKCDIKEGHWLCPLGSSVWAEISRFGAFCSVCLLSVSAKRALCPHSYKQLRFSHWVLDSVTVLSSNETLVIFINTTLIGVRGTECLAWKPSTLHPSLLQITLFCGTTSPLENFEWFTDLRKAKGQPQHPRKAETLECWFIIDVFSSSIQFFVFFYISWKIRGTKEGPD